MNEKPLSASLEDYLEAIYHIINDKHAARSKDIVNRLGIKKSSVTEALRSLSDKKLINYAPYDLITLTLLGTITAKNIVHRHETLRNFLIKILDIDEIESEKNACKMEHAISGMVLDRLALFLKFIEDKEISIVKEFQAYCNSGREEMKKN